MIVDLFSYIDPFIGSLFLQLLSMGIVAALLFFKRVRLFFANLISGLFGKKKSPEMEMQAADEREDNAAASNPSREDSSSS